MLTVKHFDRVNVNQKWVRCTGPTATLTAVTVESMYTTPHVQAEDRLALMLQGYGGGHNLPLPFWERVNMQGAPDQAG